MIVLGVGEVFVWFRVINDKGRTRDRYYFLDY